MSFVILDPDSERANNHLTLLSNVGRSYVIKGLEEVEQIFLISRRVTVILVSEGLGLDSVRFLKARYPKSQVIVTGDLDVTQLAEWYSAGADDLLPAELQEIPEWLVERFVAMSEPTENDTPLFSDGQQAVQDGPVKQPRKEDDSGKETRRKWSERFVFAKGADKREEDDSPAEDHTQTKGFLQSLMNMVARNSNKTKEKLLQLDSNLIADPLSHLWERQGVEQVQIIVPKDDFSPIIWYLENDERIIHTGEWFADYEEYILWLRQVGLNIDSVISDQTIDDKSYHICRKMKFSYSKDGIYHSVECELLTIKRFVLRRIVMGSARPLDPADLQKKDAMDPVYYDLESLFIDPMSWQLLLLAGRLKLNILIAGPSGSGKTTLLDNLAQDFPSSGLTGIIEQYPAISRNKMAVRISPNSWGEQIASIFAHRLEYVFCDTIDPTVVQVILDAASAGQRGIYLAVGSLGDKDRSGWSLLVTMNKGLSHPYVESIKIQNAAGIHDVMRVEGKYFVFYGLPPNPGTELNVFANQWHNCLLQMKEATG